MRPEATPVAQPGPEQGGQSGTIMHMNGKQMHDASWPDRYLPCQAELQELQAALGVDFPPARLVTLRQACLHSSCGPVNYKRLAHLGDAALGLGISHILMDHFPQADVGWLTITKHGLVSRKACLQHAQLLQLARYIVFHQGVLCVSDDMLAEMYEAMVRSPLLLPSHDGQHLLMFYLWW